MKSGTISAFSALILGVALSGTAAASATRVRPLSELKEQDPEAVVAAAPESAQVTLPVRYCRGKNAKIGELQEYAEALLNGQLVLQKQLKDMTLMYTAATNDLEAVTISRDEWQTAATNAAARVERVTAALDERRAEYVAKRDDAVMPTTKAIYQAFIDAIDDLKEKLGIKEG